MINLNKSNRKDLSTEDKDFLIKAISLSRTIVDWTEGKVVFFRQNRCKLNPLLVLGDIIVESQWGRHPLAQPYHNKRYSNNLTLLEVDHMWEGKSQQFNDRDYKAYTDWVHFATDYSDLVVLSQKYKSLLNYSNLNDQIKALAEIKFNPIEFSAKISAVLDFYSLSDML